MKHALSPTQIALLEQLVDGYFHSGQALAGQLGLSRGAIWQHVRRLEQVGLDIYRVPGRGYRLAAPLELLDAERIRARLPVERREHLTDLQVLPVTDSTNRRLLAEDNPGAAACFAEHQTAGRGRRGRQWITPFGGQLAFSLSWVFDTLPPDFSALALAIGLGLAGVLRESGSPAVQLKWPNDLVAGGRKLGGILVEVMGEPPGRTRVVAGVGINWQLPPAMLAELDQPGIDLARLSPAGLPGRNALAADCLDALMGVCERFAREGFAPFLDVWPAFDALRGRQARVAARDAVYEGVALGVDAGGALRLRTPAGVQRFFSGDVSVRARP